MARQSTQDDERRRFEMFAANYDLPAGRREFTDKPDVIIHGANKLGIEIRRLPIDPGTDVASEQRQQPLRMRVLEGAQQLHRDTLGSGLAIHVSFDPAHPIGNRDHIEHVARKLVNISPAFVRYKGDTVPREVFETVPEVNWIYAGNRDTGVPVTWEKCQSYSVRQIAIDNILVAIREKDERLRKGLYQRCDRYWLLLTINFWDPAEDQQLYWPPGMAIPRSGYERIVLHKTHFREVVEIPQA